TPLRKTKDPDLTHVVNAVNEIRRYLRRGQLVILESTTYPGTTEEVVQPALESSGLRAGRDFCLAFSPERVDPGNPHWGTRNIPIEPFYLSWKAKMNGFEPRFIELAGHINEGMPRFVVEKVTDALNLKRKAIRGSRIHVLGVAYKPGVNDIRESPALNVMRLLRDKGAVLSYSDPYVPALREDGFALDSLPLQNGYLGDVDCVVILTNHREFDYRAVARTARLVVDTRN